MNVDPGVSIKELNWPRRGWFSSLRNDWVLPNHNYVSERVPMRL